jgi:hypothetical protein
MKRLLSQKVDQCTGLISQEYIYSSFFSLPGISFNNPIQIEKTELNWNFIAEGHLCMHILGSSGMKTF